MRWEQIMNLVPFASRETLEALVENCVETLDEDMICNLAPFLSSQYLDQLVRKLNHVNPELVFKLAPFLPKRTVDRLIMETVRFGGQTPDECDDTGNKRIT